MTEKSDESDKPSKTSKSDLSGESDSSNNSSSVDRKASLTDQPGITPLFAATPTRKPGSDQTKKKLLDKVWEVIEQKLGGNLGNLTEPLEEKGPNQMAPIKKAVLILRPKINERWVAREESTITWAVSNHLLSKAHKILMNCDLYMGDKMIMSVFKDVPFNIGTGVLLSFWNHHLATNYDSGVNPLRLALLMNIVRSL
ncbi:hypothetical protein BD560DRAFT_427886 [Blakeslea trispora]|nr:hypothetical protein BD560DRAFT_427886 [Blakeslea trispora]